MIEGLRALDRAYTSGHHGRWSAGRRAALVDEALRDLFASALAEGGMRGPVALVALGGYGRGELCPFSDVDLMVLHAERSPDRIRAVAERVFYPLWDAGVALGHAVRTVRQAVDEAMAGVETATALLEARPIAGDLAPLEDLRRALAARLDRDRAGFLARIAAADAERHQRFGSAAHLMEPDVKESAGGLRDVHSVGWAARAIGLSGPEALAAEGLLRRAERDALDAAGEFLVRVRSAMHLETGKRTDRLVLDLQPRLAEVFGFEETAGLDAPDALMRALFDHARHVEHVRALAFERAADHLAGTRAGPGTRAGAGVGLGAEEVMAVFARWSEGGAAPTPTALDALEDAPFTDGAPWSPVTLEAFLRILRSGDAGARALETMDRVGLLARFLPEWADVRCRPQRDPYHTFTVDVHLTRTAADAARLLGRGSDEPAVRAAAEAVTDPDALLLGAFLHDAGKVGLGSHVPVGVEVAGRALERMGVEGARADTVRFLVGQHLLLVDTATRRDLSDPDLVADVARTVGDAERLALLFLLTVADARATGPHARSPWRAALVRELVANVEAVLTAGAGEPRGAGREIERAALLERYASLLEPRPRAGEIRTAVEPAAAGAHTYRLAVAALDRPGLLSKIAGALALSGLSILSAEVSTTDDGLALDVFVVEPAFHGEADEERWRRFRGDLRRALEGRISLDYRVDEKRRHYPAARDGIATEVSIDNAASEGFSVIEVSAPDGVGLLYRITRALHELELDVHLAKVATYGDRVVDAFYVRDLYGNKVDEEHAREIERAVLARLTD